MKTKNPHGRIALLLVVAVFLANPLFAQGQASGQDQRPSRPVSPGSQQETTARPQPSATRRDDPTLDTLFAADSYKMYGEVRMVGQLVRSPGVTDVLEPILKLSSPPDDFKAFIKFLNTNA